MSPFLDHMSSPMVILRAVASLSLNFCFSALYNFSTKLFTFVLLGMVSLLSKVSIIKMKSSSSTVVAGRPVRPIHAAIAFSLTTCSFESKLYLDAAAKAAWMDGCCAPDCDLEGPAFGVLVSGIWIWCRGAHRG